jgi:acyl-CoA thioesterase-1
MTSAAFVTLRPFKLIPFLAALACLLWVDLPRAAFGEAPAFDPAKLNPVHADDHKEPIRVACVGDSITFGAGVKDREHNSYPVQLGKLLGEKWDVKNFGHSGATLVKKGDSPYDKTKEYTQALEFQPNVVVIFLGTNDSKPQNWKYKDDYAGDYKDLIADFRKIDPKVRVYCCLPVPAFPPGAYKIRGDVIRGEAIPLIKGIAEETQATLIDLDTPLSDKEAMFPDKIHPNAKGAAVIAATVYRSLTGKEAPAAEPAGAGK